MTSDLLDLRSTSQKTCLSDVHGDNLRSEIEFQLEQADALEKLSCENNAPHICYRTRTGQWRIVQGCCNSWQCARCGLIRAKEEYWRITLGAKELEAQGHTLYFVTITCRGKDLDLETSDDEYYTWTNRLLSTWRARAKKQNDAWHYVQVTERQQRGAAHSHIIITTFPDDRVSYMEHDVLPTGIVAKHDCLYSQWFVEKNVSAGLGYACDCTIVQSSIGVAAYVAKYLFKDAQVTLWPKGWKRIRYSQSWPKQTFDEKSNEAFPLVRYSDWLKVRFLQGDVIANSSAVYEKALSLLITNVLPPSD